MPSPSPANGLPTRSLQPSHHISLVRPSKNSSSDQIVPSNQSQSFALVPNVTWRETWTDIARNWQQFNQRVRAKWEKLTDDDLALINGRRNRLEVKIRQRYGFSSDHIRKEVDDWVRWQQSIASAQRVPGFFLDQQNQIATKTARR